MYIDEWERLSAALSVDEVSLRRKRPVCPRIPPNSRIPKESWRPTKSLVNSRPAANSQAAKLP